MYWLEAGPLQQAERNIVYLCRPEVRWMKIIAGESAGSSATWRARGGAREGCEQGRELIAARGGELENRHDGLKVDQLRFGASLCHFAAGFTWKTSLRPACTCCPTSSAPRLTCNAPNRPDQRADLTPLVPPLRRPPPVAALHLDALDARRARLARDSRIPTRAHPTRAGPALARVHRLLPPSGARGRRVAGARHGARADRKSVV